MRKARPWHDFESMAEDWFRRFKRALSEHGPLPRDASERTSAMERIVHGMAGRDFVSIGKEGKERGVKSEFWTADFCWFRKADWDLLPDPRLPLSKTRFSHPRYVIEHENDPAFWKLLYCWWKLDSLSGISVVIGYPECPRKGCRKDPRECFAQLMTGLRTPLKLPLNLGLLVLGRVDKNGRIRFRPWMSDMERFLLQESWGEA